MSMNYSAVFPKFWTGATGRNIRGDLETQVIAAYLMTSPHANIIGVYHCPPSYICEDTGCSFEGVSKGLRRLEELDFCTVDKTTDVIWVHEMAFYQIGKEVKPTDKRLKYIHRFFDGIQNPLTKWAFFKRYGSAFLLPEPPQQQSYDTDVEGASKGLLRGFDGASMGHPPLSPSLSPTPALSPTPSQPSPSAPEMVLGGGSSKLPVKTGSNRNTSLGKVTNVDFEDWWKLYPLKKSKAGAQRSFEKIITSGQATIEELRTGAMRYAAERTNQDPKYTKHPTTWLNQGCWSDEGPSRISGVFAVPSGGTSPRSGAVSRLLNKIHGQKQEAS